MTMESNGVTIKLDHDGARVELQCPHQNGLLYAVSAESTWVCSEELRPAHALAGFLAALTQLESPQVRELMQQWGLYFRERPLPAPETPGE